MKRYAFRKDANHGKIKDAFLSLHWAIYDSASDNAPYDLIVRNVRNPVLFIEIKDGDKPPSQRKLKPRSEDFRRLFSNVYRIIESVEDVYALSGISK